jgi:hypothetical protein
MDQAQRMFSPGAINRGAGEYYRNFLGSPAFAQAQRSTLQGGNRLALNTASSLGARGMDTTGIGAVSGSLANSATSFKMGDLYSNAWNSALENAFRGAQGMTGAAATLPQPKWGAPQMYGAGLDALVKMLLMSRMQNGGYAPGNGSNLPSSPYFVGPQQ